MRSTWCSFVVAGVAAIALAGCKSDATQIVVAIDSDLRVPEELDLIEVLVFERLGMGLPVKDRRSFSLRPPSDVSIPFSFGLISTTDPDVEVVVLVKAFRAGTELFEVRAATSFVEGRTLLLPIYLWGSCIAKGCTGPTTCVAGECVSDRFQLEEVEPGQELDEVRRRRPPPSDASVPRDAEPTADLGPTDMGEPMDMGADAGMPAPDAMAPDAMPPPPDGGGMWMPVPCSGPGDPVCPGTCPMPSQGCECRMLREGGMGCVPTCSAGNTTCPPGFSCMSGPGLCVPG